MADARPVKRFYRQVAVEPAAGGPGGGWRVTLDGREIKTARGLPQVVPTQALADAMAEEWSAQGEDIDLTAFALRDLADFAIDVAGPDLAGTIAGILAYAETDTLCYRADPGEPLFARQQEMWEPLLGKAEARHGLRFERVSGILHRPQPAETLTRLKALLEGYDAFTLAALKTLASLAASLVVGLEALEDGADAEALWATANLEEDWQAEQWGWDWAAEELRAKRLASFAQALGFARLAREG
jgi:chaperone required for assembly of F1-ATPase